MSKHWDNNIGACILCRQVIGPQETDIFVFTSNKKTHNECWDLRFQQKTTKCCIDMRNALRHNYFKYHNGSLCLYDGEYDEYNSGVMKVCPFCTQPIVLEDNPFYEGD